MRGVMWAGAALAVCSMLVGLASAELAAALRVDTGRSLPRTFLLELEEAPTARAFRQNRPDGLAPARQAARDQKRDVIRTQREVADDLPAGAEVLYRTQTALAAVGVRASAEDKLLLEAIPGVRAVHPVAPKRLDNAYAVPFQAAPVAWQTAGLRGEGQEIAVIDTGIDYTHAGFGGPGSVLAYEQAQASEGLPADPLLFPNEKVVGGVDLVGDDYNADPGAENYQPEPHPDPNPLDCEGHGSHVAGSAAGYGVTGAGTTFAGPFDETTDFEALEIGPGVAPEADLYAIKVFGCTGSTDVVAQAIDHAVDPNRDGDPSDRVGVINLSLGTDFGSVSDGDSVAAAAAVRMGVSVVAAAGNAGDVTDISGSPGDAAPVLSVASSVDAETRADGAEVSIDGTTGLHAVIRSALYDWKNSPDLSGPVVLPPAGNETACSPYEGTPFNGEIVLVEWHDAAPECRSIDRGAHLAAAGAGGFIFGSDSEVFSAGINGDAEIPGVLMVASGANAIRDALDDGLPVAVEGTDINAVTTSFPEDNDKVSGFTSRGLHAVGNVKPDVTAVGSSIFSVAVGSGSEGTSSSGTSMASPMVAGLAALVRQARPGWSPLQVKADIMNTAAHDLRMGGSAQPESQRYGPPRVGAGRIDAAGATTNRVLAYDPTNGAVSASFGPVEVGAPVTLSREITVENASPDPVGFDVSYDPINDVPGAAISASPATLELEPGESTTVTVDLALEPSLLTKAVDPTVGRMVEGLPRETLAEAFGRVLLEPAGPGSELRVPVYASPRPASDLSQPGSLAIHRTASTATAPDQVATLEMNGEGVGSAGGENGVGDDDPDNDIFSIAAGFELQALSGESPACDEPTETSCWQVPEERYADLAMVGYTSNAPRVTDPVARRAYFAVAVHSPWAIPADKAHVQFDLDVDGDAVPDLFLFNGRAGTGDVFTSVLLDPEQPPGEQVIAATALNARFGDLDTALYDSDVMVLPVRLQDLAPYGIDSENPRIEYGVESYSFISNQPIDLIGVNPETGELDDPLSANLYEPGLTVTGPGGNGPLVEDQPGEKLTVKRHIDSYREDDGLGLMMLHFHNRVGSKAQAVRLRGAASRTEVFAAPGTLSARIDATVNGLPEPTGRVEFRVDGEAVGEAPVEAGVAELEQAVANGATREVEARYLGSADFEPSTDRIRRADPRITARVRSHGKRNRFGWFRHPVTVTFHCRTRGSQLSEDCPYPRRLARDGRGQLVRRSIVALDGGRDSVSVRVNLDRTRPIVRIRGVRRGATYRRVRRARCVARDRTSGVLRCHVNWFRRGKRITYVAKAVDRAGNRRTVRVRVRLRR